MQNNPQVTFFLDDIYSLINSFALLMIFFKNYYSSLFLYTAQYSAQRTALDYNDTKQKKAAASTMDSGSVHFQCMRFNC